MNFIQAKKIVIRKRIIGLSLAIPALISTVISILRMLYFRLDDGTQIGNIISTPVKNVVLFIYHKTTFLSWFWNHSPTPDQMHLLDKQSILFLIIYIVFFVGLAIIASAKKLNLRLQKISQDIEDQLIAESIRGEQTRSRQQIEESVNVASPNLFTQFNELYLAPVITGIIVAFIIKFLGL